MPARRKKETLRETFMSISARKCLTQRADNLLHFWDDVFVEQLGPDAKSIASELITPISKDDVQA